MILSIFNQKGGVGKTTTAVNLAAALSRRGSRVLLLDMDGQANASALLGVRNAGKSLFDALVDADNVALSDVILEIKQGLCLAPGSRAMDGLDSATRDEGGRELILREQIEALPEKFDYVICDNGPTLSLPVAMSLCAADLAIIPLLCERLAVEGLSQTFQTVEKIRRRMNPKLEKRILLSMLDGRFADGKAIASDVRATLGKTILQTTISTSARLKEGAPVFELDATGKSARDFEALAQEVTDLKGVKNGT